MNCINTKSQAYLELLEASKLPSLLLEMRIAKWQEQNGLDSFPKVEDIIQSNEVNQTLKAVDILQSDKAKQVFDKGKKANWDLNKILTELQISKEQKQLILDLGITDREQIALELASSYSYSVEINTAKKQEISNKKTDGFVLNNRYYRHGFDSNGVQFYEVANILDTNNFQMWEPDTFDEHVEISKEEYLKVREKTGENTSHYSNLTVPGGTNYTENEIATPLITPSIKGHAQFATDNGIGWFRSDEQIIDGEFKEKEFDLTQYLPDWMSDEDVTTIKDLSTNKTIGGTTTKTRRILEVQSDLFQKGRDKDNLDKNRIERIQPNPLMPPADSGNILPDTTSNKFLQLLNKDSNWVTFFVKSIIQDSAKKGYEKVLFPSGNTASKVEGHTTLEEFKKQKEDRIKELEKELERKDLPEERIFLRSGEDGDVIEDFNSKGEAEIKLKEYNTNLDEFIPPYYLDDNLENNKGRRQAINEITQLKQELEQVEGPEGFGALKPIYNFYENTVTNILNKTYGKDNVKVITDEYGNTWNEITLDSKRDESTILFNKINNLLDTNITKEVFSISELNSTNINKNVDNSQINKQLLFNTNNQNSLLTAEVLTNIIEQIPDNLTDEFKVLIDKARKILGNTKAKVEVSTIEEMSKKYNDVDSTVAMLYDANTNKIVISEEALTKLTSQEVVQSFIHEVVHAIVVKAIKNPQTFEEKEAKKFFEKAFEKYKRLAAEKSNKKESYGFTNIDEFIAEIYSNPEFQNELKEIQGFWNELKNVIRRLINMIKSLVNDKLIDATLLINKVNDLVEQTNNSDFNGYSAESGIRFDAMFIRNSVLSESEGYNLDTIEKQIQNVLNKAKDILNQNIAHYKAVTKSIKDPVKKQQWTKFVDSFDDTLSNLETLKDGEELTGILNYVNSLQKGVASLKSSFDRKEFTEEETIQVVHNYTKYLDSFTIHKDIQKLLSDIKVNNKFDSDTIDISEIENALDSVVSDYTKLKSEYSAFLKNAIKLKLSTLKYLPELETMWINKLKTEYKSSPKSISQTEWIANAMNTTYKEDINADIEDYLNKLINNPSFDISIGTHFFNDSINTNSHLIQIFNQILNEVKEEINQTMREKEAELKILFDELVKEKGSSNPSVLYKNLVFKNPNGNYSLVNDEKGLSKIEKEVLKGLKDIQDYTDYSTYRKQSKKVKINGQVYYELPSITKSDLERVLEGDIKGTIKDKWTDLTTIKADDVEFRYKTDNDHNLIYNVPVRYRAKIEAKDQSLDLFTVYRLEYLNGVNFKVKTKAEKDLTTILDIAKSKEYYRNEGGKNFVKSVFSKNNEIELTPGEKSNTVKRLESLLEKNIYDIGHKYAGKLGAVDINKAISFANSATAAIGLNLNRYAATANVLNAKAQMFLESISKGTINKTNLLKAEALYTKELGSTMKDLGQPVEKSFINQMNRMFDTFGFDQNAMNDFVKQGLLKSYTNAGSLQFMHKTGEHWVQSTLTAAVLDSIKVMNSDNRFIDKKGNEVSEDKAASLLDMLYIDSKDGILKISDKVVYTTKSLTSKINEGGKEKINLLVKKKIFDCFGNYDSNTQPEAKRHAWGKLLLMFRGFFTEMLTKRYKAFGTSLKSKDEIDSNPDKYKHYNYALQEYDEGTYTSLVRFLKHGVIPMLKQMKFHILSQEWEKLSDLERANIKHSVSEITATLVILPLIGMLLGSMLGGNDDDDEIIYFWLYQTRRLTTELAQFRNPSENIKMTRSPIPSMRLIENGLDVVGKTLNFWSWDEEIKSGPNKGDLKIGRAWGKMIPVLNQIDKNSKDLYKYQTAMFGSY